MIDGMTILCLAIGIFLMGFLIGIKFGMFLDRRAEQRLYNMIPSCVEKPLQYYIDSMQECDKSGGFVPLIHHTDKEADEWTAQRKINRL